MSYYYPLRRWGGDVMAWCENRGTGRCVSVPIMIPVLKSPPPPATGRGSSTRGLERPRPLMVVNHWHTPTPRSSRYYGFRPHAVPWPGCLCSIFPVSACLHDTILPFSGLLRVYSLDDAGDCNLSSLNHPLRHLPSSRQCSDCADTQRVKAYVTGTVTSLFYHLVD